MSEKQKQQVQGKSYSQSALLVKGFNNIESAIDHRTGSDFRY